MTPDNWIALGGVAASAIVTGLGLYFGPRFAVQRSLEQFRSQKWWEKRHETYNAIIEHLSTIQVVSGSRCNDIEEHMQMYPLTFPDFQPDERSGQAYTELRTYAAQGTFLVSEKAAEALHTFHQETWPDPSEDMLESYTNAHQASIKCLATMVNEAKLVAPQFPP
jgi:hypothetical protein